MVDTDCVIDVKERPILFSGPMVRAILEGRKTQTRRILKPQPEHVWGYGVHTNDKAFRAHVRYPGGRQPDPYILCPYGKPGDRLWVRETFFDTGRIGIGMGADMDPSYVEYRADFPAGTRGLWKPSIHMPRWASRLTLEIVSVKVERLQDISEDDARDEGAGILMETGNYDHWDGDPDQYRKLFRELWESINEKGSWDSNPWLWAIEFKVVTP